MASHDLDNVRSGQNIILRGSLLQILIFGLFVLVSIIFHLRLRKQPTRQSKAAAVNFKWQKMIIVLYVVSALIMVRNIVRVVEYIGGREGPLLSVEWPIYCFDALLMAATIAVWLVWYPTSVRPRASFAGDTGGEVQLAGTHEVVNEAKV